MSTTNNDEVRKRKHLSPEEKYQIFLEATIAKGKGNGQVGEVLRRWGIHASDLTRIRETIEQSALQTFKERKSRKPKISREQYDELLDERQRLHNTIVEQAAELAILKKKVN